MKHRTLQLQDQRGWETVDSRAKTPAYLAEINEATVSLEIILLELTPSERGLLDAGVFSTWGDKALIKWAKEEGCDVSTARSRLKKLLGRLQWRLIKKGFDYAN